ncbi:MAG: hypothetical protein LBD60_04515 [Puniceicoccales bacterium]|jgi:hypothetical protein|nr:hypothetical protein [Puniceicoccales bacterium]
MLPEDRDAKLLQLFQLKRSLEQPDRVFWERFDAQLRQKFLGQEAKVSLWARWCDWVQRYRIYTRPLAYVVVACCVLRLGTIQFNSSKIGVLQSPRIASPVADIIPFSKTWTDVTLAFDSPSARHVHYICDHIHTSRLNSKTKELVF